MGSSGLSAASSGGVGVTKGAQEAPWYIPYQAMVRTKLTMVLFTKVPASSNWNKELAGFMARGTHVKGRKTRAPNRLVAARDWRCSEVIVLYTKC